MVTSILDGVIERRDDVTAPEKTIIFCSATYGPKNIIMRSRYD